ncbi:hypothetical protein BDN72DRAFT_274498 [Pluteus cervinus]|uniref:Uncharacterized protein n=1 Tax=Pluteus cervinus TaxID=181527 RepID=A0ACD3AFV0_9AGAR|nr:hypothetical protein BDN72DRAFT_274498 [Pluteus cervinus]
MSELHTSFPSHQSPQHGGQVPSAAPSLPENMAEPWKIGSPLKSPTPADSQYWKKFYEPVRRYDKARCAEWRDEIDKLLLFASLFSAVATSFAIESYQWLDDSPDETFNLLSQLISIQLNSTASITPVASPTPSMSDIRINICWFLSLILSLITVLVGVLCTQWLRAYERDVPTSFEDKLRYRQVRYEGIVAWKVPRIIGSLPLLLQSALILFFVGVVELLWQKNRIVAIVILVPVACAMFFLIATSTIPILQAFTIRRDPSKIARMVQCPYKSASSWMIYGILVPLLDAKWLKKSSLDEWKDFRLSPFQSLWPGFDHFWVRYDSIPPSHGHLDLIPAKSIVRGNHILPRSTTDGSVPINTVLTESIDSPYTVISESSKPRYSVRSRSIEWIRTEFRFESASGFWSSIYEFIKDMDDQTTAALTVPVQQDFQEAFGVNFTWDIRHYDVTREVACVTHLYRSPIYRSAFLEHLIKLAHHDRRFLVTIPTEWASTVPAERRGEFSEQMLMCTLSAMEGPLTTLEFDRIISIIETLGRLLFTPGQGSAVPHLLRMNLHTWTEHLRGSILRIPQDRVCTMLSKFVVRYQPQDFPVQIQPYVANLTWTAIKMSGTKSEHLLPAALRDAWLNFFKLENCEAIDETSLDDNTKLWWITYSKAESSQ